LNTNVRADVYYFGHWAALEGEPVGPIFRYGHGYVWAEVWEWWI